MKSPKKRSVDSEYLLIGGIFYTRVDAVKKFDLF